MKKGFTFLEIIAVLIIMGLLSTLAIGQYTPARERALGREAISALRLIASAERLYRMEIDGNTHIDCQCLCAGNGVTCCNNANTGCNRLLKLDLTPQNWFYSVIGSTNLAFNAQAVRTNGNGCQYSINQAGVEGQTAACP